QVIMASLDELPDDIIRMFTRGLPYKDKLVFSQVNRRLRNFEVPWELHSVKLHKFPTTFNVSATITEPSVGWKFLSFYSEDEDVKAWKGKNKDNNSVNYNLKFAFPLVNHVSIFSEATIRHLEVDPILPIYVENDNLEKVAALFAGCTIDKVTLVFDNKSLENLNHVPRFLSSIHTKHVGFVLLHTGYVNLIAPFNRDRIAAELVKAGVREITLSGSFKNYRSDGHNGERAPSNSADGQDIGHYFIFNFLPDLFETGINRINMGFNPDKGSSRRINNPISGNQLDGLLDRLASLDKCLRLQLSLSPDMHPMRRYTRADDEELGRVVHVDEVTEDTRTFSHIDIQHNK
ncbi:hypothetical protein PENTCL1PPCAC_4133, partial [Pristionchus entomophagus]